MRPEQIHLALTHVPVIVSLTGLGILIAALIRNNKTLLQTSAWLFIAGALGVLPVYFSGEGAEEAVEHLPGVAESIIEHHEEMAQFSAVSMGISGLLALALLIRFMGNPLQPALRWLLLLSGIGTVALMIETAHLGGQIRHTEIRNGAAVNSGEGAESSKNPSQPKTEKDDD